MQHTAVHCNTLQHTATHCNTLQHAATHCNTLQHTAARCSTLQQTKETYLQEDNWFEKRPIHLKWDQFIWKKTNLFEKRTSSTSLLSPFFKYKKRHEACLCRQMWILCENRPTKETNLPEKRPTKEIRLTFSRHVKTTWSASRKMRAWAAHFCRQLSILREKRPTTETHLPEKRPTKEICLTFLKYEKTLGAVHDEAGAWIARLCRRIWILREKKPTKETYLPDKRPTKEMRLIYFQICKDNLKRFATGHGFR